MMGQPEGWLIIKEKENCERKLLGGLKIQMVESSIPLFSQIVNHIVILLWVLSVE